MPQAGASLCAVKITSVLSSPSFPSIFGFLRQEYYHIVQAGLELMVSLAQPFKA